MDLIVTCWSTPLGVRECLVRWWGLRPRWLEHTSVIASCDDSWYGVQNSVWMQYGCSDVWPWVLVAQLIERECDDGQCGAGSDMFVTKYDSIGAAQANVDVQFSRSPPLAAPSPTPETQLRGMRPSP